jgi:hypothetical protein
MITAGTASRTRRSIPVTGLLTSFLSTFVCCFPKCISLIVVTVYGGEILCWSSEPAQCGDEFGEYYLLVLEVQSARTLSLSSFLLYHLISIPVEVACVAALLQEERKDCRTPSNPSLGHA